MDQITNWLLEGDAAIRWQTQRDLLNAPESTWQAEQQSTVETGWGARLLALQDADGGWGGGIYAPKWTSATYTLLALRSMGVPRDCAAAQRGARLVVEKLLGASNDVAFRRKLIACDRCIVGMILQIAVYFGIDDERIECIVDNLLSESMPDGAWNCRRHRSPKPHHSSFHTTFNVLEGLRTYLETGKGLRHKDVLAAEQGALELMLQHRLFKSDKTGEIINPKFTKFALPHFRWQYDVLRGLDYFAAPMHHVITAYKMRSICLSQADVTMVCGQCNSSTAVKSSLQWKKSVGQAGGTPCAHCVSYAGGMGNGYRRFYGSTRPLTGPR